ncbi:MAG TPA: GNAT family N-acetyltransferase [Thermoanaerobaculia bacterium]|nr:GNAT family N-acetyltransferase [Thermoanaerobaculia bacterium]
MIAFREAAPADAPAILALRRRCFPDDELEKPRPSRMFLAEEEGRPVAHLGFIPQTYVIGGNEYAGALAVDAMTDPDYRRQGLFRRVAAFARDAIRDQYALSTAWQIRPAVLSSMIATGWQPVLRAPVLIKPLLIEQGAGRRARCAGEKAGAVARVIGGSDSAYVRPHPDRFAAPYYEQSETCTTRETTLKGHPTLAILDLTARPVLPKTTARLAAALMTWRHPLLPQLLRSGFLPSPYRFRFLVNAFDPRIDAKRARWALTWADTDHL